MPGSPYTETDSTLTVDVYQIDVTTLSPQKAAKGTVVFLHGAGESSKDRCLPLARALSKRGYRCITFSFPGHGNSSGALLGSTLAERRRVAAAVINQLDTLPIEMLVAVSMGAHTAISLLEDLASPISRLVLLVPAIYTPEAETMPFGPQFSEVIRRPQSYLDAKAWDILPSYQGKLAMIQTEKDEVIPPVIYDLIQTHATVDVHHVLVADSPHRITTWLSEEPARVETLADALDRFDFDGLASRLR